MEIQDTELSQALLQKTDEELSEYLFIPEQIRELKKTLGDKKQQTETPQRRGSKESDTRSTGSRKETGTKRGREESVNGNEDERGDGKKQNEGPKLTIENLQLQQQQTMTEASEGQTETRDKPEETDRISNQSKDSATKRPHENIQTEIEKQKQKEQKTTKKQHRQDRGDTTTNRTTYHPMGQLPPRITPLPTTERKKSMRTTAGRRSSTTEEPGTTGPATPTD